MKIKLYICKQIRRFEVQGYKDFVEKLKTIIGNDEFLKDVVFQYLDCESDWITFNSELEFSEIKGECCIIRGMKKCQKPPCSTLYIQIAKCKCPMKKKFLLAKMGKCKPCEYDNNSCKKQCGPCKKPCEQSKETCEDKKKRIYEKKLLKKN